MFAEWTSLSATIVANSSGAQSQSVLAKFAGLTGREVAVVVVKPLAANLGPTALAEPSSLVKDEEVRALKLDCGLEYNVACLNRFGQAKAQCTFGQHIHDASHFAVLDFALEK